MVLTLTCTVNVEPTTIGLTCCTYMVALPAANADPADAATAVIADTRTMRNFAVVFLGFASNIILDYSTIQKPVTSKPLCANKMLSDFTELAEARDSGYAG